MKASLQILRTVDICCNCFEIDINIAVFTARRDARIASAVLATAILSICLSHTGIVSKRRHVARCSLHCWIAKCV